MDVWLFYARRRAAGVMRAGLTLAISLEMRQSRRRRSSTIRLMMSTTRPAIVLAVGLTVALPTAARAQRSEPAAVTGTQVEDSGGSLLGNIGRDYRRFFTSRETAIILSIGIASSMGVRPFDGSTAGSRLNGELYQGTGTDAAFEGGELLGGALFQVGSAVGRPGVVSLGRDLVRAQLLTQGVTQAMKYGVRRTRQDGSNTASFPSGHSSGTFASATVLHRHYGWKAGVPAYAVATWVAASRLNENKHFLSDVTFGAVVGILGGRTVTFDHGSTRVEVAPLAVRAAAGVQLTVTGC